MNVFYGVVIDGEVLVESGDWVVIDVVNFSDYFVVGYGFVLEVEMVVVVLGVEVEFEECVWLEKEFDVFVCGCEVFFFLFGEFIGVIVGKGGFVVLVECF